METNFKLKTKKPGGGSSNPRKPPKYFTDFVKEQRDFNKQVLEFMEFVTKQFKKHGWTK